MNSHVIHTNLTTLVNLIVLSDSVVPWK